MKSDHSKSLMRRARCRKQRGKPLTKILRVEGILLSPTHPYGLITPTVITLRGLLQYQVGQIMEQVDFQSCQQGVLFKNIQFSSKRRSKMLNINFWKLFNSTESNKKLYVVTSKTEKCQSVKINQRKVKKNEKTFPIFKNVIK